MTETTIPDFDREEQSNSATTSEPVPEAVSEPAPELAVRAEYDSKVTFALQQNDVPLIRLLQIENKGTQPALDLSVHLTIGADFAQAQVLQIAGLQPRGIFNFESISIPLDSDRLANQLERESTFLQVEISQAGNRVFSQQLPLEVLAYNEWGGLHSLPEMIAAFVQPNHPVINKILTRAKAYLQRDIQNPSLNGYQSKNPEHVRWMASAIYAAIQDAGITYCTPPASFEEHGQKIRLPEEVFLNQMGSCLDLSVFYAACLEQAGLHPLLIFTKGHAFVGAWTGNEVFPQASNDDGLRLRKRVDLDEILVVEATSLAAGQTEKFAKAEATAERALKNLDDFQYYVDVQAARKAAIRPLPIRVADSPFQLETVDWQSHPVLEEDQKRELLPFIQESVAKQQSEPVEFLEEVPPVMERLYRWKRRLLDLSLRNRLINFRQTKKSMPVLCPDLHLLEDALASGTKFSLHARPKSQSKNDPRDQELTAQRTGQDPLEIKLQDAVRGGHLHLDLSAAELEDRVLNIYRTARLSLEESGANTLFLAIGFLRWYETPSSDQPRMAPILLLPMELERRSMREGFRLYQTDEDPRINVTLLEKLRTEFGIEDEALNSLPEDEAGLDVAAILKNFRKAIRDLDRWDLVECAHLGLFSFNKFLMWFDLEERVDILMQNQIIEYLVKRPDRPFEEGATFPQSTNLDQTWPPAQTFCPMDADSSQLTAIFAAENGHSFVLEGPPGTGKSQTITNLIAHCLAHGKRVLFVAEKTAALSVVKKRLDRVGLSPFCLELHSNKTSKREVLAQLEESLSFLTHDSVAEWKQSGDRLQGLRDRLNEYVDIVHNKRETEDSFHNGLSRLVSPRTAPSYKIDSKFFDSLSGSSLAAAREAASRLQNQAQAIQQICGPLPNNPLTAVQLAEWHSGLEEEVDSKLRACAQAEENMRPFLNASAEILALHNEGQLTSEFLSRAELEGLTVCTDLMLHAPSTTAPFMYESNWTHVEPQLRAWINHCKELALARQSVLEKWDSSFMDRDPKNRLAEYRQALDSIVVVSWLKKRKLRRELSAFWRQDPLPDDDQLLALLEEVSAYVDRSEEAGSPYCEAKRYFDEHWRAGQADPRQLTEWVDWTDRCQEIWLQAMEHDAESGQQLRDHWLKIVAEQRDQLQPEAKLGRTLQSFQSNHKEFEKTKKDLQRHLKIRAASVFGSPHQAGFLPRLRHLCESWRKQLPNLRDWCHWQATRKHAEKQHLSSLLDACESGKVEVDEISKSFDNAFYQQWLNKVMDEDSTLRSFNRAEHERQVQQFREADRDFLQKTQAKVRGLLGANIPTGSDATSPNSEMGILLKEIRKKRRHMPTRKLFQKLPNLMPRLKPCALMSPLSVAQYLDAAYPAFDIVVFDEASQIPVWDAVGSIARGNQVVVVGDSKQLPPTSFFMKSEDPEDVAEDEFEELESLLDEAVAARLPSLRLNWHYRSRHESLIAFSNSHYYQNGLFTFPSPSEPNAELGVHWHYVEDGLYEKGKSRTNKKEASAIVGAVIADLQSGDDTNSIGIVTLSSPQQVLIEDMLEKARSENPALDRFFSMDVEEPVFVKNLENVQGDERDKIFLSICYGPDPHGKVSMNFGPLNREGGERRLNVAVTRARKQVRVFSSLRPDQIDLSRTQSVGVRNLRGYLEYAQHGTRAIAEIDQARFAEQQSGYLQSIAAGLRDKGWEAETQVGCSAYRVDIAVRDKENRGSYVYGVQTDGMIYAKANNARDRDRTRHAVMSGLGWSLISVWSPDWLQNPDRELERLDQALRQRKPAAQEQIEPKNTESAEQPSQETSKSEIKRTYVHAELPTDLGDSEQFYDPTSWKTVTDLILKIVDVEAPVHTDYLTKKVLACWNFGRTSSKAQNYVHRLLSDPKIRKHATLQQDFLWKKETPPHLLTDFRIHSEKDSQSRQWDEIPLVEYGAAGLEVLKQNISLPLEDLTRQTLKIMGIRSRSSKAGDLFEAVIKHLEENGHCQRSGNQVNWSG